MIISGMSVGNNFGGRRTPMDNGLGDISNSIICVSYLAHYNTGTSWINNVISPNTVVNAFVFYKHDTI